MTAVILGVVAIIVLFVAPPLLWNRWQRETWTEQDQAAYERAVEETRR